MKITDTASNGKGKYILLRGQLILGKISVHETVNNIDKIHSSSKIAVDWHYIVTHIFNEDEEKFINKIIVIYGKTNGPATMLESNPQGPARWR